MDSDIISEPPLFLTGLEHLKDFNGKFFDDLPSRLQMRLRETELVIHLIRKGTPAEVKFNIFARINTGGVALSSQELRHAITPGPARKILETFASEEAFLIATDYSVRSVRMDDRELVLRFLAFRLFGVSQYTQPDMDGFLIRAMKRVNTLADSEVATLRGEFVLAMVSAYAIFETDAFRKRYSLTSGRLPINKALFESISVNLALLSDAERIKAIERRQDLRLRFISLCGDRLFEASISQGTGDIAKVQRRFQKIHDLLRNPTGDDNESEAPEFQDLL